MFLEIDLNEISSLGKETLTSFMTQLWYLVLQKENLFVGRHIWEMKVFQQWIQKFMQAAAGTKMLLWRRDKLFVQLWNFIINYIFESYIFLIPICLETDFVSIYLEL